MTKQQEFRKQTEEAKFEAFSFMCKKVVDLENENAEAKEIIKEVMNWYQETDICSDTMPQELRQKAERFLNSEVEK